MKKLFFLAFVFYRGLQAQPTSPPYYELPPAPEKYSAGTVASRMVDGLGFRFYWATEGLRAEDLSYKPSGDARSCEETMAHIYEMSLMIRNAVFNVTNTAGQSPKVPYEIMRTRTLQNLQEASRKLLQSSEADFEKMKMVFKRDAQTVEFPFWNMINGPIEDCVWHVGQIVTFRRASGNPINENISLLSGKANRN